MKRYLYSEIKLSKVSKATDVAINRSTSCITRNFRGVCFTVLRSSTALTENTDQGRQGCTKFKNRRGVLLSTRNSQIPI